MKTDYSRPPEPDAPTAPAPKPEKPAKGKESKQQPSGDASKAASPPDPPKPAKTPPASANGKPALPSVGDTIIDADRDRREDAQVIAINDLLREQRVTETRYHIKIRKNGHICNLNESELRERFDLAKTRKAAPTPAEED